MPKPKNTEDMLQDQFVKQVSDHLTGSSMLAKTMCEKAGLSEAHWSNIKSHWKRLTLEKMAEVANALGKKVTITLS
jgi:hypothetical protein